MVIFSTAALAACGTEKLSDKEVAAEVKSKVLSPRGISGARVRCPAEAEAKKGAKIRCSVSDPDKNRGTVTGTVLDEDGKLGRYRADVGKLQMAVIERNAAKAGRSKGIEGEVECPDSAKAKKGAIHFCTADIRGSGVGIVLVTQKDTSSNVGVKVQRRRLRTAQIESKIAKAVSKQGINADVKCPPRVTSQKGKTFECSVTNPANGRQITVVATQKDDAGNFAVRVK